MIFLVAYGLWVYLAITPFLFFILVQLFLGKFGFSFSFLYYKLYRYRGFILFYGFVYFMWIVLGVAEESAKRGNQRPLLISEVVSRG